MELFLDLHPSIPVLLDSPLGGCMNEITFFGKVDRDKVTQKVTSEMQAWALQTHVEE